MAALDEQIKELMKNLEIGRSVFCSPEENKKFKQMKKAGQDLPEEIFESSVYGDYYHLSSVDPHDADLELYLALRKLKYIRTIKNCCLYFLFLSVISLAIGLLMIFGGLIHH